MQTVGRRKQNKKSTLGAMNIRTYCSSIQAVSGKGRLQLMQTETANSANTTSFGGYGAPEPIGLLVK